MGRDRTLLSVLNGKVEEIKRKKRRKAKGCAIGSEEKMYPRLFILKKL